MLKIEINMNSSTAEVLAFKTCCGLGVFDQNLEILVTNRGAQAVVIPCAFDLVLERETRRFDNLFPSGELRIEPGEVKAFYCQMDENLFKNARALIIRDSSGNEFRTEIQ